MIQYPSDSDLESNESQQIRYREVADEVLKMHKRDESSISIIDFGSGRANFFSYLSSRAKSGIEYRGVDLRYNEDEKLITHVTSLGARAYPASTRVGSLDYTVSMSVIQDLPDSYEMTNFLRDMWSRCMIGMVLVARVRGKGYVSAHHEGLFLPSLSEIVSVLDTFNYSNISIRQIKDTRLSDNFVFTLVR